MAESFPLSLSFPSGSPAFNQHLSMGKIAASAPHSLPVYPTQLMHHISAILLALAVWLYGRSRLKRCHGEEILLLGMLYPWARFVVEFFRADNKPEYLFGSLTISQSVGIFVFAGCLILFVVRRVRGWGRMELEPGAGTGAARDSKDISSPGK